MIHREKTMTENSINDIMKDSVDKDYEKLIFDIKYDKEQFKDPATIGLLLYRLSKERERSNFLFKEIVEKLDDIKKGLSKTPSKVKSKIELDILSEVDQEIIAYTQKHGKIDAEQLREHFHYKGKNAASARLNALFQKELLAKARAGKKVLYWVKG